jgi:phytoene dehydrogenase-like protein
VAADFDAIVIGAGHNGLITAAYLARDGVRTLLLEARPIVGGTAGSEPFAGASVNLCSCDHLTIRTTPVIEELDLEAAGLRYLDLDPALVGWAWSGGPAWRLHHDAERTIDGLADTHPGEVEGYRRYLAAARPAARLVLDAAREPPRIAALTRLGVRRRFAGLPTVLRWSRSSAASVLRRYFASDALLGPALVGGPMVWGVSPEARGTGLGALGYAMRHVGRVGRPVGGSGALTDAVRTAFEQLGGELRTSSPVRSILCAPGRVRGVMLADGTEITADVVVSAADPRRTFVEWLRDPPAGAQRMVERWRARAVEEGYESKIDVVASSRPRLREIDHDLGSTLTVAPSVADMHRAATAMMASGDVLARPGLLVNVPSIPDPSLAPAGRHVVSLEVLLTPYRHRWSGSAEPERWLALLADLCEPGWRESIVAWRAMTPDVYERDFHLPRGHATSFGGGPLAAFRSRDPELTRYETAVPGLYLTGAATFPGAGIWGASGRNCAAVIRARME